MYSVQVMVTPEMLALLPGMTEAAISRAITRVRGEIPAIAKRYVPEDTGALLRSLDTGQTPKSLVFGFSKEYAEVVDVGRPGGVTIRAKNWPTLVFFRDGQWHRPVSVVQGPMAGRYYMEAIGYEIKQLLMQELVHEFQNMSS